jgi:hypothetical protein
VRVSTASSRPEARLHAGEVELVGALVDAELGGQALAVGRGEVHRDGGDLAEQVEVGGQVAMAPSRNTMFLMNSISSLGMPGADAEQRLDDPLDLAHQLVGRHGGGVDRRLVEAEVPDDRVEVGVGRQRPEVAQRGELAAHVVHDARP